MIRFFDPHYRYRLHALWVLPLIAFATDGVARNGWTAWQLPLSVGIASSILVWSLLPGFLRRRRIARKFAVLRKRRLDREFAVRVGLSRAEATRFVDGAAGCDPPTRPS